MARSIEMPKRVQNDRAGPVVSNTAAIPYQSNSNENPPTRITALAHKGVSTGTATAKKLTKNAMPFAFDNSTMIPVRKPRLAVIGFRPKVL